MANENIFGTTERTEGHGNFLTVEDPLLYVGDEITACAGLPRQRGEDRKDAVAGRQYLWVYIRVI